MLTVLLMLVSHVKLALVHGFAAWKVAKDAGGDLDRQRRAQSCHALLFKVDPRRRGELVDLLRV